MNPLRLLALLLLSSVFSAGCSGVTSVESGDLGAWGEVRVTDDLSIGASTGAPEYLFGTVGAIAQLADGTVIIADTQVPIVRRFDAEGVYLNDIGRAGQGPGEYTPGIRGIKETRDGNVAVWDTRNRRISLFTPEGELVREFAAGNANFTGSTLRVDRAGNLYVYVVDHERARPGENPPLAYLEYSPTGEQIGKIEVAPPQTNEDPRGIGASTPAGQVTNFMSWVLAHALISTGHLVVGRTSSYSFEIRRDGGPPLEVSREWEPVPLTAGEKAQWEALTAWWDQASPPNFPKVAPVPDTKPPLVDLFPGEDGTIWVQLYAPATNRELPPPPPDNPRPQITWLQQPTFDAFDEEGTFLGRIELPDYDAQVLVFHSDYLWTIRPDENGETLAVRYRIEKTK